MNEKSKYKIYIKTTERHFKEVKLVEIVGVVNNDASGIEEKVLSEKSGDIDLVSTIRDMLNENKLKVSDIEEFVPALGPGSFTGLKIGVTVANILNWSSGKRSVESLPLPDYGAEPNIS